MYGCGLEQASGLVQPARDHERNATGHGERRRRGGGEAVRPLEQPNLQATGLGEDRAGERGIASQLRVAHRFDGFAAARECGGDATVDSAVALRGFETPSHHTMFAEERVPPVDPGRRSADGFEQTRQARQGEQALKRTEFHDVRKERGVEYAFPVVLGKPLPEAAGDPVVHHMPGDTIFAGARPRGLVAAEPQGDGPAVRLGGNGG